jgi:hypothetical protein
LQEIVIILKHVILPTFYIMVKNKNYVNWFHIYSKLSQNELLNSDFKIQLNLKCFKIFTIRWYMTGKKLIVKIAKIDKGNHAKI